MTNDEFRASIEQSIRKKYGSCAKIKIALIYRASYEENYSNRFKLPAAIDFTKPVAIVTVRKFKIKEIFLVFIDKRGHGHICPEDTEEKQHKSAIANFEVKSS